MNLNMHQTQLQIGLLVYPGNVVISTAAERNSSVCYQCVCWVDDFSGGGIIASI